MINQTALDVFAESDRKWMREALRLADHAASLGEIPVGAVVVRGDEVIGRGFNLKETDKNPMAHAEIMAIESASEHLGAWRLQDCTLYVNLEPCCMCAGALV